VLLSRQKKKKIHNIKGRVNSEVDHTEKKTKKERREGRERPAERTDGIETRGVQKASLC